MAADFGKLGTIAMIEMQTLTTWREETAAELVTARQALADAIEAVRAAQAASDAARAMQADTQNQLAIFGRTPLANRLRSRLEFVDDNVRTTAGNAFAARNQIALLAERIEDIEAAQRQIAQLIAAMTPTEAVAEEEHADAVS